MSQPTNESQDKVEHKLIAIVEAAKLAGYNAESLSYDGKDDGYSNQREGYYDTVDAVKALLSLIAEERKTAFTAGVAMSGGDLDFQEAFYDQWQLNLKKETL